MNGFLLIISAPSGAGKTTICREFLAVHPEVQYAISTTTRSPREGEVNGKDYFFVSRDEFDKMIEEDAFLEYARVYNEFYGTSREFVLSCLRSGRHVLIDVDIEGASQIRSLIAETVSVYILPPSLDELEKRLLLRDKDSPDKIKLRLSRAQKEIAESIDYDYSIINEDVDTAVKQLGIIYEAEKLRVAYHQSHIARLTGAE